MTGSKSLGRDYFEAIYQEDPDPWKFATSAYEDEKYGATIGALSRATYADAIEIGCSIGVLTARLALRCRSLDAVDLSPTAVAKAKIVCAAFDNIRFHDAAAPHGLPPGPYDLIILSEVLYYLDRTDLATMARWCRQHARAGCEIVLCHWLGPTDYPLRGALASELFLEAMQPCLKSHTVLHDEIYRLERFCLRA